MSELEAIVERDILRSAGVDVPVLRAHPAGATRPLPGVLLLHGSAGLDASAEAAAVRLAGMGFVAAAPDLFARAGDVPRGDREAGLAAVRSTFDVEVVNDVADVIDELAERPACSGRTAAVGMGVGGRVALLLATSPSSPERVVACYGDGMVKATALHDSLHPQIPVQRLQRLRGALLLVTALEDADPAPAHVDEVEGILVRLRTPAHRVVRVEASHDFLDEADPLVHRSDAAATAWGEIEAWLRPLAFGTRPE